VLLLFEIARWEIIYGRFWAYNPYDLKTMRPEMQKKKKEYVISRDTIEK